MTHKCIQGGQLGAYGDTAHTYLVTTEVGATDAQVWAYMQTVHATNNRAEKLGGYPFGFESYGTLKQFDDTTWRYTVTEPYTD